MKEEVIKSVQNIIESVIRVYEKRVSEEKVDVAIKVNHLLKQAEDNNWDKNYINAIKDVKKVLRITNTIYDLYV
jgi:hypothetical protein